MLLNFVVIYPLYYDNILVYTVKVVKKSIPSHYIIFDIFSLIYKI